MDDFTVVLSIIGTNKDCHRTIKQGYTKEEFLKLFTGEENPHEILNSMWRLVTASLIFDKKEQGDD